MDKRLMIMVAMMAVASSEIADAKDWPVYVNNKECFTKKTCGAELGNMFPEQNGVFYDANHRGDVLDSKGVTHKITYKRIRFGGYDAAETKKNPSRGVVLQTTNYQPTGYILTGLDNARLTLQIRTCNTDESTFCKDEQLLPNKSFTFTDLLNGDKTIDISLGERQTVKSIKAWFSGASDMRLITDPTRPLQVRSLRLPSILMNFEVKASNGGGNSGLIKLLNPTDTRLNNRMCELRIDKNQIQFGSFTLSEQDRGKISSEFPVKLSMRCNGYTEELGDAGKKTISGEQVIHTISSVHIDTDNKPTIGNQQRIGLKNNNTVSDKLYVEGSFAPLQECGIKALSIGNNAGNPSSFDANGQAANDMIDGVYNTIYWKLCKEPGKVPPGNYTGNAKIKINYK